MIMSTFLSGIFIDRNAFIVSRPSCCHETYHAAITAPKCSNVNNCSTHSLACQMGLVVLSELADFRAAAKLSPSATR